MQPPAHRMHQFLYDWAVRAQDSVLAREAGPRFPVWCETYQVPLSGQVVYRCAECYHAPIECEACVVSGHCRNPFHRIEEWLSARGFWLRKSLGELNMSDGTPFTINLGHNKGSPCLLNQGPVTRSMVFVHDHGIHKFGVRFCLCADPASEDRVPYAIQLIREGFWPGSWTQPETAFTIRGLQDQQLLSLQSHMSMLDYVSYLARLTDNVCSEDVPVSTSTNISHR